MSNIKALIVIYNKPLSESITLRSIKDAKDIDIYIADNSTKDFGNTAYARENGYNYFDMGANLGLSKAYNKVISSLDKKEGLICLFDDDTQVGVNYFDSLRKDSDDYESIDIFAPVVRDQKGILSPCKFVGARGVRVKDIDKIPRHGISAINSGLAVRLKVFNDYKYDEGQFLDYIDHAFIRDVINQDKSRIRIMDVVFEQHFSACERTSKKMAIERFNIFKKDFEYYCKKYRVSFFDRTYILLKRRAALALKLI